MSVTLLTALLAGCAAAGAMGAAGIYHLNRRWRRQKDASMEELAGVLGGELRPGSLVGGQVLELWVDGLGELRLFHASAGGSTRDMVMRLQIALPRVMPRLFLIPRRPFQGLHVQADATRFELGDDAVGQRFHGYAEDVERAGRLLAPEVRQAWLVVERLDPERTVELALEPHPEQAQTLLVVGQSGWVLGVEPMRRFLEQGVALARAAVQEWDRPWHVVAGRWGLVWTEGMARGLRGLQGEVSGLGLLVRESLGPDGPQGEIRVAVQGPPGLRVAHRALAQEQGWLQQCQPVGNPVLDMLVAARAADPQRARALLSDDELTSHLLEVVHAHPGSELDEHGVRLECPGLLDQDLELRMEAALRLGLAVRDGLARLEAGEAP